jgi:hypothetical protein
VPRPERLTVQVHPPDVHRSTVTFRWTQDLPNALQTRDRWFVRYHGVPVDRVSRRLLYDVLLSLQLPVWAAMARTVEVQLPEPVGRVTLDFWSAYHRVGHRVSFTGQVDDARRYDPRRSGVRRRAGRRAKDRPVAVTFGGGKDSTLAQQALLESRPAGDVLLLHLVQLFAGHPVVRRRTTLRSLRTVVGPNWRRFRTPVQLVTTDYMAVLRRGSGAPRPHVNLYVGAMLPALVHHGVRQVVFSRTALGYRVDTSQGRPVFANPSGRPERLEHLRRYTRDVLGWDLHAESSHRAIGEFVSFGAMLREFPRAFEAMVMCTRTLDRERFCHDCPKCLEFAVLGLAHGHVAEDLDYDRLLTSRTVAELAAAAEEVAGTRAWHGSAPYRPQVGTASHFATWCHALHLLDPDHPELDLSAPARAHLGALKEAWGPVPFPAVATLDEAAVAASGPVGRATAAVAARGHAVRPGGGTGREDLLLVGDEPAGQDHEAVMPTPELDSWAATWGVPGVDGAGPPVSGVS